MLEGSESNQATKETASTSVVYDQCEEADDVGVGRDQFDKRSVRLAQMLTPPFP